MKKNNERREADIIMAVLGILFSLILVAII